MPEWTFITNHGLVLASIAENPKRTAREIGDDVGVTERTAHKVIMDLEKEGYITKTKSGVKNTYIIHPDIQIRTGDAPVRDLLMMLVQKHHRKPTR
ncbi:helix-turn-helix transcriptional regulator [Chloroflexota bacterium]